ncbi:hypothetical protein L596_029986 [Steinernema carpocapsae]|uniref:Dolichol phosphate-mannose biosynthesis regulatory protein n=1 Tax=Steinernema carpocapsae TaxID=34508 RepID=A0A4U5LRE5_STECR|nr:hypothetical protein L596_029986 [Steinernema carpocapsae]
MDFAKLDKPLGYGILAFFGISVPYLLVWLLIIPFMDSESLIRMLFPSQKYALLIPLCSFLAMVTVVGTFGIGVFVKEWFQGGRLKKKPE